MASTGLLRPIQVVVMIITTITTTTTKPTTVTTNNTTTKKNSTAQLRCVHVCQSYAALDCEPSTAKQQPPALLPTLAPN